jgi:hypothetical protein
MRSLLLLALVVQTIPAAAQTTILTTALGVLWASAAAAQTTLTSYELRFYQGGATPTSAIAFPAGATTCGQTVVPTPVASVNPRFARWDDPAAANRQCVYDLTTAVGGNPIPAFPVGQYTARLVVTDSVGLSSTESSDSNPFFRADPPAAPTGLSLGQ